MTTADDRGAGMRASLILMVHVAYLYVALEWLFFVTKPSLMDSFTSQGLASSLLVPPAALWLVTAPIIVLLEVVRNWLPERLRSVRWPLLVPTFFLASAFFLLIDNFLYTFWKWGVIALVGYTRFVGLIGLLALLYAAYDTLLGPAEQISSSRSSRIHVLICGALLGASTLALLVKVLSSDLSQANVEISARVEQVRKPNIILLASDAIEARHLSLYGAPFPTSPFLTRFASRSLVFENAFVNAGKTTGTTVAMLTGKSPYRVKVGFPPQILPREHAFQHLPGVLRALGYRGFQRTIRYYGDAGDLNMQGSFTRANARNLLSPAPGTLGAKLIYLFNSEFLFSSRMTERLVSRILHVLTIKEMINHYLLVKENKGLGYQIDSESVDEAIEFARAQEGPFFMHLHLMASHCCDYDGTSRWFASAFPNLARSPRYVRDGKMLSSIRDADRLFAKLVYALDAEGILENTIVAVSSDHTQGWDTHQRVPLLIRFPGDVPKGRVKRNVELVDLPATILDYMGIESPDWMTSRSLLREDPAPTPAERELLLGHHRPILSMSRFAYTRFSLKAGVLSRIDAPGPPLYGVKMAGLVLCDRWTKLDLETGQIQSGKILGHTDPCPRHEYPPNEKVRSWIVRELEKEGFSISF
jgi:hypothetical protein